MKRPNLRIIGTEEVEEYQFKWPENTFNKIIEENFPNLKEMAINIQLSYRVPNRLYQKRKSSCRTIIRTLNVQNRERIEEQFGKMPR